MHLRTNQLVVNATVEAPTAEFRGIRFRTNGKVVRHEKLEGEEYLVVPMVMIVEGVLNGVLYNEANLSKTPESWNHKPVVVYHPDKNGEPVSACSPEVLNAQKIGLIMHTKWDSSKKRLVAEAWLKENRVKEVDERIWNAIQDGKTLELSTGLWVDNEKEEGEFNGKRYTGIAHNFRPDHLAVLPDQIGACSIEDGAGFIRNQAESELSRGGTSPGKIAQFVSNMVKGLREMGVLDPLTANELSHEEIRQKLVVALREKHKSQLNPNTGYLEIYIAAVYDDVVIYSLDWRDPMYSISYSTSETGVKLSGEPQEVVLVTEYRNKSGAVVGNRASPTTNKKQDQTMDRKNIVDGLIKNNSFSEEDREWLMGLEQKRFDKVVANTKQEKSPVAPPAETKPSAPAAAPAANKEEKKEEKKSLTVEEYIANAPEGMRDMLSAGLKAHSDQKATLVSQIVDNCGGADKSPYSKEELEAMSLVQLNKLATATKKPARQDYSPLGSAAPATNAAGEGESKPLTLPTWDFSKK